MPFVRKAQGELHKRSEWFCPQEASRIQKGIHRKRLKLFEAVGKGTWREWPDITPFYGELEVHMGQSSETLQKTWWWSTGSHTARARLKNTSSFDTVWEEDWLGLSSHFRNLIQRTENVAWILSSRFQMTRDSVFPGKPAVWLGHCLGKPLL